MLAMLIGCGLQARRTSGAESEIDPAPRRPLSDCGLDWKRKACPRGTNSGVVKTAVDVWKTSAQIVDGCVFRSINKGGKIWAMA
jgi:hypothetical protein